MIFDTNALSAFLLADRALLAVVPPSVVIRLPVIVLGEYRFGLLKSRERVKLGRLLDEFQKVVEVLPVDEMTVQPHAEIREQLHKAGRPIPQNDTWIAALAVQHQLPVLTKDRHFETIAGVRCVSW
jgi:predicted nucleic acid-binding protein